MQRSNRAQRHFSRDPSRQQHMDPLSRREPADGSPRRRRSGLVTLVRNRFRTEARSLSHKRAHVVVVALALLFFASQSKGAEGMSEAPPNSGPSLYAPEDFEPDHLERGRYGLHQARVELLASAIGRTPRSLALGDFDADREADLAVGYARGAGGVVTILGPPVRLVNEQHEASFQRDVEIPVAADFLAAGDFNADGYTDLAAAARAGSNVWFLFNQGNGSFGPSTPVYVGESITAFLAEDLNRHDGLIDLALGVTTVDGYQLVVLEGPLGAARSEPDLLELPTRVESLVALRIDNDAWPDLTIATGNTLVLVPGRDRRLSLDERQRSQAEPLRAYVVDLDQSAEALAPTQATSRSGVQARLADGSLGWTSRADLAVWMGDKRGETLRWQSLDALTSRLALPVALEELRRSSPVGVRPRADDTSIAAVALHLDADAVDDVITLESTGDLVVTTTQGGAYTFIVNSTDDVDDGSCTVDHCSLREAIIAANAELFGTVSFADLASGDNLIIPTSQLPAVGVTGLTTVDGWTHPDGMVEISGVVAGNSDGLHVLGGFNTVRGLVINGFSGDAVVVEGQASRVEDNYIGTTFDGGPGLGNGGYGVLCLDCDDVLIRRNVIAGSLEGGVRVMEAGVGGVEISDNLIGTDVTGTIADRNDLGIKIGDEVAGSPSYPVSILDNLISGNSEEGVLLEEGGGHLLQGNRVGTNLAGTAAIPNSVTGITSALTDSVSLGGTSPAARNVVSGNPTNVRLLDSYLVAQTNLLLQGNYIGPDVAGAASLGGNRGLEVFGHHPTTLGGSTPSAGNLISGHELSNITIDMPETSLHNNLIGTDAIGESPLSQTHRPWLGLLFLILASRSVDLAMRTRSPSIEKPRSSFSRHPTGTASGSAATPFLATAATVPESWAASISATMAPT